MSNRLTKSMDSPFPCKALHCSMEEYLNKMGAKEEMFCVNICDGCPIFPLAEKLSKCEDFLEEMR